MKVPNYGKDTNRARTARNVGRPSGTLLRTYFSVYWPLRRKARKIREKVRKQLMEEGIAETSAERLAKLVVPDLLESFSLDQLMRLAREES